MKIDLFNVNVMKVEEDFGFHQLVKEKASNLPRQEASAGYAAGLKTAAEAYDAAVIELDKVLKSASSVPSAIKASQKDKERSKAWLSMRRFVRSLIHHPDADVAKIADDALKCFDRYGDLSRATQMEETGRMFNLIQDLNLIGSQKLDKAGISPFLKSLEQKNKDFVKALNLRIDEKGERDAPGTIKKKREAADAAYRRLVEVVNALIVVNGEASYQTFSRPVNALIDEMRATLAARRTTGKKRSERKAKEMMGEETIDEPKRIKNTSKMPDVNALEDDQLPTEWPNTLDLADATPQEENEINNTSQTMEA